VKLPVALETAEPNMEDDMLEYSGFIVLFLLIPVVAQIVIPLLLLVGYGLRYVSRAVFAKQTDMGDTGNLLTSQ
jgi:hypothetical protein